jgi:hypothetical protein
MKKVYATGAVVVFLLTVMAGGQAPAPSAPRPFPPPPSPPQVTNATKSLDLEKQTIEQLIQHVTSLKKQRKELEQQEAAAVAILKKKLVEANRTLAELESPAPLQKVEEKKTGPRNFEAKIEEKVEEKR